MVLPRSSSHRLAKADVWQHSRCTPESFPPLSSICFFHGHPHPCQASSTLPLPNCSCSGSHSSFRPSSQQNLGHSISVSKEHVSLDRQPAGPSISASKGCDPFHGARSSPSKATKPPPVFYFPFCFWIHAATC